MNYQVSVREVAPMEALTIRFTTSMKNIAPDMGKVYQEVWDHLERSGAACAGDCFAIYHCEAFDPENIDVECGFSLKRPVAGSERVVSRTVEGGLMAAATHKGPYETLSAAYEAIMKWAPANGYELLTGWRDYYLNDPQALPPEEWLTEVACPVSPVKKRT